MKNIIWADHAQLEEYLSHSKISLPESCKRLVEFGIQKEEDSWIYVLSWTSKNEKHCKLMCVVSFAKTAGKALLFNPGGVVKWSICIHIIIDLWWSHLSSYTLRTNRFLVENWDGKIDSFSIFYSVLDETNSYKDNEIKYVLGKNNSKNTAV